MRELSVLLFFGFLLLFTGDSFAQASRGISAAGRRMDDFDNQRTKAQRDAMAREMRGKKFTKEELQNAARIKAETKEDLEGLQESYNEIVVKLNGGSTVPTAFIAEAANRVHKHAVRLKANVAFPKPEMDEERKLPGVGGDTRKQLRELCTSIYELLTNPMIESPQVLDLEAASSARNALEAIIVLSDDLSKR